MSHKSKSHNLLILLSMNGSAPLFHIDKPYKYGNIWIMLELEDVKHSRKEKRKYWIGKINDGRVITIRFTRRKNVIRIFGAAQWREFRRLYYEKAKNEESKGK